MCASTGLRHGGFGIGIDGKPFAPLDEREVAEEVASWWASNSGQMKITGKNARNLNSLIRVASDGRELAFAWWWIWPTDAGPAKYSAFNARDDNLTGPAWSKPFQHRALIPANWYIEKGVRFAHPTGETFGIAAITNTVKDADGNDLVTYSMVTREAVGEAAATWNRMPLVLPPETHDIWLDPEQAGTREFATDAVAWSAEVSRNLIRVSDTSMLF